MSSLPSYRLVCEPHLLVVLVVSALHASFPPPCMSTNMHTISSQLVWLGAALCAPFIFQSDLNSCLSTWSLRLALNSHAPKRLNRSRTTDRQDPRPSISENSKSQPLHMLNSPFLSSSVQD